LTITPPDIASEPQNWLGQPHSVFNKFHALVFQHGCYAVDCGCVARRNFPARRFKPDKRADMNVSESGIIGEVSVDLYAIFTAKCEWVCARISSGRNFGELGGK